MPKTITSVSLKISQLLEFVLYYDQDGTTYLWTVLMLES